MRVTPRHGTRRVAAACALAACVCYGHVAAAQGAPADTLVDALERERALWRAERDALEAQRREVTERAAERAGALREEVARARERHAAAWAEVARLERELAGLDARLASAPRGDAGPEVPLEALERELGLAPAPDLEVGARITRAFEEAGARVESASAVTLTEGDFFLSDGTQTRGRVARIGQVGALGVDAQGRGGVLIPTSGAGAQLQVVREAGAQVRAWVDGDAASAPVVFYDPSAPPALEDFEDEGAEGAPARARTWRDTVEEGAPVGHVILALGALALLVFALKVVELTVFTTRELRVGKRMLGLAHGEGAEELEREASRTRGAISRVALQAASHREMPLELYENSVQAVLLVELAKIGRGLSVLRTVAAVAPLLGLLGTVVGMTATFEALTVSGSAGDPQALSGGIAQALATTQIGLTVAVPALLGYGALRSWATQMEGYVEHAAIDLATHVREVALGHDHGAHDHDHGHDEEGA
jgi:biopolymer transport protein ExbB